MDSLPSAGTLTSPAWRPLTRGRCWPLRPSGRVGGARSCSHICSWSTVQGHTPSPWRGLVLWGVWELLPSTVTLISKFAAVLSSVTFPEASEWARPGGNNVSASPMVRGHSVHLGPLQMSGPSSKMMAWAHRPPPRGSSPPRQHGCGWDCALGAAVLPTNPALLFECV